MILTTQEAADALFAAAEKKALAAAAGGVDDDLLPEDGSAAMSAAHRTPTGTVAAIRAKRATVKQLFDTDPAGGAMKFGNSVGGLLSLLGLG